MQTNLSQQAEQAQMFKQQPIILCVDDNDAARYSVVRSLQLGGYKVVEARTGAEALRLAEDDPDLITLDVQLPDINGFEVCRRLRANVKTARIPILHISASRVEVKDRVNGLGAGADGYLVQPVNNDELLATVQSLLRLRRAEREAYLKAEEAERARNEAVALNERLKETVEQLRLAQATILEREERLRIAQEAAHSGTWDWNFETGELIWSPEEEALYGLAPGTFTGHIEQWRKMVQPEDLAGVEKALQHAINTHTEFHVDFRITRPDGAARWIESFGRIFYDDYSKAKRMVGVNSDVTERKNTEEALRKSEFRFRRLVDSNIIPIVVGRIEGVTEANDAFLKMIGYTREELAGGGIDWVEMTPAEHLLRDMEGLELLKKQGFCPPFEKEYVLKDGRRVPFLVGATVVGTSPLEWLGFVVDLSDLKRAEAELRKAHDELERKVSERTQELAEMVITLKSEMQVRKKTEQQLRELSARLLRLQDEERRRIARDLHDSTGQVLTALKIKLSSSGAMIADSPTAKAFFEDSTQLADQALQEIRTLSHLLHPPLLDEVGFSSAAQWYVEGFGKRSGIIASLELSQIPALSKDAELVYFRVLQESLTNVLRHSGSKTLDIRLSSDSENAVLSIRDYGKGIPSEKLDTFRETGAGVGVGLGGMKQRVRELGGHLTVESSDSGTCVTATLPLAESHSQDESPRSGKRVTTA